MLSGGTFTTVFRERTGVFNPHTQYGTIKLKQFSIVGETAPVDTETLCTGLMFFREQTASPSLIVDFHFVVVMDLEPYLQVRDEHSVTILNKYAPNKCMNIITSFMSLKNA